LFYSNLIPSTDDDEPSFRSYVKGIDFYVDADLISRVTGCPNDGIVNFDEDFNRQDATNLIFREGHHIDEAFTASNLPLQNRLLHWTINHIIHPRTGSLNLFNDFHLFFLYHIIRGVRVNLPLFILKAMMAVPHNDRLLSYGGIITRILKIQHIDLSIEKSIPL